jgi:thioredoxin 1
MSTPVVVTDSTFAEVVLGGETPVLVEFWAPGCGPCRMLAPVLVQIAAERAGSLVVATVNAAENPKTAISYGVLATPTLALYRGGDLVWQTVGARSRRALLHQVDDAIAA